MAVLSAYHTAARAALAIIESGIDADAMLDTLFAVEAVIASSVAAEGLKSILLKLSVAQTIAADSRFVDLPERRDAIPALLRCIRRDLIELSIPTRQ